MLTFLFAMCLNSAFIYTLTGLIHNWTSFVPACKASWQWNAPSQTAVLSSDCGTGVNSSKASGGQLASLGAWPWQVSLQVDGSHRCGGAVISPYWIVTAAQCVGRWGSLHHTLLKHRLWLIQLESTLCCLSPLQGLQPWRLGSVCWDSGCIKHFV